MPFHVFPPSLPYFLCEAHLNRRTEDAKKKKKRNRRMRLFHGVNYLSSFFLLLPNVLSVFAFFVMWFFFFLIIREWWISFTFRWFLLSLKTQVDCNLTLRRSILLKVHQFSILEFLPVVSCIIFNFSGP